MKRLKTMGPFFRAETTARFNSVEETIIVF